MIRSIVFLTMLFCYSIVPAQAATIETTPIGRAYNDGWWYVATSAYIGPGNRGGTAIGFYIAEPARISVLNGFIRGIGDTGGYGYVAMSLHRGSRFGHDNHGPLPSNDIIFQSERMIVPLTPEGIDTQHSHELDIELTSGEYWVAFQGGSATPNHMIATGASFEGEKMAGVHAPEPATMLLMAGGLAGLLRFRRKISA